MLRDLFSIWLMPPAAHAEVKSVVVPDWIEVRPLAGGLHQRVAVATLGPGEREAISLALGTSAAYVILDDLPARSIAEALGLNAIGAVGVLIQAKRYGLLDLLQPHLNALRNVGFFLSEILYQHALDIAGEA
jgi:uncharacterized protein